MKSSEPFLVVIAGGSGTRFWPKSTAKKPKQLLHFGRSSSSLLAQTLSRFDSIIRPDHRVIVTTQSLQDAVLKEAPQVTVLAEPQGRNTAPCIYWAARWVAQQDPKAVMLIMPSDHFIQNSEAFLKTVQRAIRWASEKDNLVTLGIQPTRPETGYGYLQAKPLEGSSGGAPSPETPFRVQAFVEKPNLEKAEQFIRSPEYFWNGGMFVWRAEVILRAFDEWMPEMKREWEKAGGRVEEAYPHLTATSIDYGVMEKATHRVMFPLNCGWDDLGSWTSLETLASVLGIQEEENVLSSGELIALNSNRNIIDVPGKVVGLLGIDDLIIVEAGQTLMVAHKHQAQEIRKLVEKVKKLKPELT